MGRPSNLDISKLSRQKKKVAKFIETVGGTMKASEILGISHQSLNKIMRRKSPISLDMAFDIYAYGGEEYHPIKTCSVAYRKMISLQAKAPKINNKK